MSDSPATDEPPARRGQRLEYLRSLPDRLALASALRGSLRGYDPLSLRRDVLAGLTVGVVALPLSMALAIATGVPPQSGLYTAIIAGFLTALLGGSRTQVSGPTAAFVVVLAPITARYGLGGLLLATSMAGVILVALGLARLGGLIQYIPHPVTTGFTAGIGLVIATLQVKDFLGLTVGPSGEHFPQKVRALVRGLPSLQVGELAIGTLTLATLLVFPRLTRRFPAPLVGLAVGGAAAAAASRLVPGFSVATIGSRFGGIPQAPPTPLLPWNLPGAAGVPLELSEDLVAALLPSAFAIAMLGAIESLLSAVVADGMAETKHDPDGELVAQGLANVVAPFFGGFASTGAIARTATNVRSGGRTPVASMVHALFVLLAMLLLAPVLGHLPMASLAALLLVVAWNMSEPEHFIHMVRVAPRSDVAVLVTCFGLTIAFDMVVSVSVGFMLATLLFIRRMVEVTDVRLTTSRDAGPRSLPPRTVLYHIGGPLFFGAAQKALEELGTVGEAVSVVLLDMADVPAMDITGLVALQSALTKLERAKVLVVLVAPQAQPRSVLARGGIVPTPEVVVFVDDLAEGVALAEDRARAVPPPSASWGQRAGAPQ